MAKTLGTQLAELDERRFVGRERELALVERLLADRDRATVLLLHGPGGIGKSALLREVSRRAQRRSFSPHWVEGRQVSPDSEGLGNALAGLAEVARPLLIFDSFERISGIGGYLRRSVLPSLPGEGMVIISGRTPPEGAWFRGGWEAASVDLELEPLPDEDAIELLRSRGVAAEPAAREVLRWAGGSPLALTLAAEAGPADPGRKLDRRLEGPEFIDALIQRLTDEEVRGPHLATIGAAAIARVTTPALLRAARPDADSADEFRWLASRTYSEPLGGGVALHELVGKAVRADLRRRASELERQLRRRIADYLHDRASATGDLLLSIDLAHLAEGPALRWGYSWEASARYRLDDPRPGDAELVGELLRGTRHEAFSEGARRYFEEAPENVAVARDSEERLAGYVISVAPASAPPFAADDPVLGPRLAHAREHAGDEACILCREIVDFTRDPATGVIGMLGLGTILRPGQGSVRFIYIPVNPELRGAREFSATLRTRHLAELDVRLGAETSECHLVDNGPGGILSYQRDVVYRELGIEPPPRPEAASAAPAGVTTEAVRDALRHLGLPHELARSPLASGEGAEERAESVLGLVADAVENAFGESESERQLRQVVVRGYVDPAPSHELAAEELSLSRATYFRRLRAATERLTDYLAARAS